MSKRACRVCNGPAVLRCPTIGPKRWWRMSRRKRNELIMWWTAHVRFHHGVMRRFYATPPPAQEPGKEQPR